MRRCALDLALRPLQELKHVLSADLSCLVVQPATSLRIAHRPIPAPTRHISGSGRSFFWMGEGIVLFLGLIRALYGSMAM